jgi:hypothetical protein
MSIFALLLLAAIAGQSSGPADRVDSWHTVQRMCGRMSQRKHAPSKRSSDPEQDSVKALRNISVELYIRQGDASCCAGLVLAGKVLTDKDGAFSFKKVSAGTYWIAFDLNGHPYSYPLRYEPAKHADPDCDMFSLELDEDREPPLNRVLVVE